MKDQFPGKFSLATNKKNSLGLCPIIIRSRINSHPVLIVRSTKYQAKPANWDKRKGRVKGDKVVNEALKNLEDRLSMLYTSLKDEGKRPTLADLWPLLEDARYHSRPDGQTVVGWIDSYLTHSKDSAGKKKAAHSLRSHMDESLTFRQLKKEFLLAWIDGMNAKGTANNSAYKMLCSLKIIVGYAGSAVTVHPDLARFEIPYTTSNGTVTRLSFDEVRAIEATEAKGLEQMAKELFLLACYSGLRISDIFSIHEATLEPFYLEKMQVKTNEKVFVTLHKYNETLIRKYHAAPPPYTRQRLSDALKNVLERAGITEDVYKFKHIGSKVVKTKHKKYTQISFHAGRRFYARLLSDLNLGAEITRDELGHGHSTVTERYSGSTDHRIRISRVRKAFDGMEETMKELALMMVA